MTPSNNEQILQSESRKHTPAAVDTKLSGSCQSMPCISTWTNNTSKSSRDSTPRTYEHGIGEGSMTSFVSFNVHLLIINLTHVLILL